MQIFSSVHHVAIICSDYTRSKDFYTQILGFPILHEVYRKNSESYKLDLRLPNGIQLELFNFKNSPKRQSYPEACGLRHLAFAVDNIVDAISYLQSHNIVCEPIRVDLYTNKQFTFFCDPDNLPLELYENEPDDVLAINEH